VSRILFVWELGGNLGHITPLLVLARALRKRGHEVSFALGDARLASEVLTREGFSFVQAPILRSTAPDLPREPASYPEILFHCGFADATALTGAVRAWRKLYRDLAPDLILFDHAPTALLAARGTDIPRVVFGTGFASPPRVAPMPSIRPWQDIPRERLQTSERRALETANAALRAVGAVPMGVFHELFDVEENILATLPELDHYGARPNVRYWGPVYDPDEGDEPRWPEGDGKKVFVYLRPSSPGFRPFADLLRKANLRTLWFAPSSPIEAVRSLETASLAFASKPLKMSTLTFKAKAAILSAGHGTAAAMLLGGVPMVLVPRSTEQLLLARQIAASGAGVLVTPHAMRSELRSLLMQFLEAASYSTQVRSVAVKYIDHGARPQGMIERIEQWASMRTPIPTALACSLSGT
jgi:UDP:flavonoid glycosyltransferase YjiC (YdhE family)